MGPGAYIVKAPDNMPHHSFGTDLGSDITSNNHVRAVKIDKPGPGSYSAPDVQFHKASNKFSKDTRKSLATRSAYPGPNNYDPIHETEQIHQYSIPQAPRLEEPALMKSNISPGPCAYNVRNDDKAQGVGKSILGGTIETQQLKDN